MKAANDETADTALKAQFESLRNVQEGDTPTYESIVSRNARREIRGKDRSRPSAWLPGLALASAAAMILWFATGPDRSPTHEPWVAGQWAMPTDVLLDLSNLPGDHMLYELPEIGTAPASVPEGAMKTSLDRRIPV